MAPVDSFKDFVAEQLHGIPRLECRRMFGGYGLYAGDKFFGIVFKEQLYFKTNAETVGDFKSAGMKPFRPNKKQTLKNYYEVPADVLEDREMLRDWVMNAIAV